MMKKIKRSVFVVLAILWLSPAFGQILNPVKWQTRVDHIVEDEYDLIFVANIEESWWTYSQHIEEGGPIPTSFEFDPGDHFELIGSVKEEGKWVEKPEPFFDNMILKKFLSPMATFTQKVRIINPAAPITGYHTFMACDKSKCLPPKDIDFEFVIEETGNERVQEEAQVQEIPEKKVEEEKVQIASAFGEATTGDGDTEDGILEPVKWTLKFDQTKDNEYDIRFVASIDEEWTVYSMNTAEDGPIATAITLTEGEHIYLGAKSETGKMKEGPDPYFDNVIVKKFLAPHAEFIQSIVVKDASTPIDGYLTFMACDKKQCLPPADIDFWINPATGETFLGIEALERIENMDSGALWTLNTAGPNLEGNIIDQVIPTIRETYASPLADCAEEEVKGKGLLWTFIFGFGAGLLALLTPCVFPMIPLTVSFFTKDNRRKGWVNGLIYGISIIVIYVAIGLLITGVFGATALNELSTNWIANVLFFVIFIFFAFSFFGYYEITLPSSWANKSDSMADKGGLIGIFFMAFTLALVSFSCTGPLIGTAIVQSATDPVGPFIVMLGFSAALALPFGLFAAFPSWLNTLPKSGGWMNSVKVVLGFLELALALKFLSVADMTMHWGILGYELFMGLWFVIFAGLTLYLFGFIKFPHDSPLRKLSLTRGAFALGSLAITVYLATGFFYNDKTKSYNALGLMSGLAPPAYYNYFLPQPEIDGEIKSKYASFTKCANNLDCFKDYYEGLAYARENNKPIFLDFTGYGCVNCRKTEEHIWVEDRIWNKLQNDFVLISLYVDDRKKLEQALISKSRQEKLRNIGNKWADFQIVNFEQNSQPLYVMMTPEEKILSKPRGYKEGVSDYANYMDCGLQAFKGLKKEAFKQ
jgi:thiol:disulfide interchange protein DsbD